MEDGARGVLAGLAEAGYQDGQTIRVRRFNAEGDAATSNTIARAIVGGDYELIITLSTPSLQAVAAANRDAQRPHVFGMVSDPVAAGVGIARDDPRKHPPYMVGLATMQPVAEAFRMARRINPKLAKVGVAWNPSEANSEACTKVARAVCKELGIELLEASVENAAAVREAVASVIGRGAEAIWIGGDNTVLSSLEAAIGPARAAGVPVFTNIPGSSPRGGRCSTWAPTIAGSGVTVGQLAARVLAGRVAGAICRSATRSPPSSGSTEPRWRAAPGTGQSRRTSRPRPTSWWSRGGRSAAGHASSRPRRHGHGPSRTWRLGLVAYTETHDRRGRLAGLRAGPQGGRPGRRARLHDELSQRARATSPRSTPSSTS